MSPADSPSSDSIFNELDLDRVFGIAVHLTGGDRERAQHLVERAVARVVSNGNLDTQPGGDPFLTGIVQPLLEDMRTEDEGDRELEDPPHDPRHARLKRVDPDGRFLRRIPGSVVADALDDLPMRFRIPLVLSDVAGLGTAEIARLVDSPRGTVSSRLFRARRALESRLLDYTRSHGLLSESD